MSVSTCCISNFELNFSIYLNKKIQKAPMDFFHNKEFKLNKKKKLFQKTILIKWSFGLQENFIGPYIHVSLIDLH